MATTGHTLLEKIAPRAKPLIITVFGDTIAPRGGSIWLSSLIDLMHPLGLSERLVRTGVYRLVREGWLKSRQDGRRSFYTITDEGLGTFAEADSRIYASTPLTWNNKWAIVQTLPDATPGARKKMRDLLTWQGFGQLSPTMMIKPGSDTTTLKEVLKTLNLSDSSIVFTGDLDEKTNKQSIITNGWDLHDLSTSYANLLDCFRNANTIISTPQDAFVARSLLIHQYRRILLKDPQLPNELLPSQWNGELARKQVAKAYCALSDQADQFIVEKMQCGDGKHPGPTSAYHKRFTSD